LHFVSNLLWVVYYANIDHFRLGLAISDEAIEQMKAHVVITDEDLQIAAKEEAKRRHDVMGHVQYVLHSFPEDNMWWTVGSSKVN
jgi:adenylosuccinate lyase